MSSYNQKLATPMPGVNQQQQQQQQQQAQSYAQNHPAFGTPPAASQDQTHGRADDPQFDIFEWHPKYVSCQRYFLDHAQHSAPVQAMAAFMNVLLPCQQNPPTMSSQQPNNSAHLAAHCRPSSTTPSYNQHSSYGAGGPPSQPVPLVFPSPDPPSTSLFPYLRRLVVTGLDFPGVLHGFFGDDWAAGIGPLHEQERRNLLFAAKSSGWMGVKKDYDIGPLETVPFLRPLQQAIEAEVSAAERSWSEWLAMEDWMVGPRAPGQRQGPSGHEDTGGVGATGRGGGEMYMGNIGPAGRQAAQDGGETRMSGTERVGEGFAG